MSLVPELGKLGRAQGALEKTLEIAPAKLGSFLGSGYGAYFKSRFYGAKYAEMTKELLALELKNPIEIEEYEKRKLRAMIEHCYDTVPYYRRSFDRLEIHPEEIRDYDDLTRLPILKREELMKHCEDFISISANPARSRWVGTSGTTGTPLKILWDRTIQEVEFAYVHAQWRWAGFSIREKRVTLRGNMIVPQQRKKPPFWIYNLAEKQLYMSAFHLRPDTIRFIAKELVRFKPAAIQAYPSALYILCNLIDESDIDVKIPIAFTASEPLYDHYRERIESVLDCKIYDMYGQTERVAMAAQCEEGGYHVFPGYGILEFVDNQEGSSAERTVGVIGTGLNNWLMPLIRYDTGDIGESSSEVCKCGLSFPTIGRITTKSEDIIITPEGAWITPSVLTHPFKNIRGIIRSQIIQEEIDLITVKLMVNEFFTPLQGEHISNELKKRLGQKIRIKIQIVENIPYSGRGKFRWIISKVEK